MKILYFTSAFSPHDLRFLTALASTENEVHYLPILNSGWQRAQGELSIRVKIERPLYQSASVNWLNYVRLVRELRLRVGQIQPDLVHAGPIHLGAAITALAGFKPLVSMSWGSDLLWEARRPVPATAARIALRSSAAFIGDCEAVRRAAIKLGMDKERITLFPWGVDLRHFTPGSGEDLRARLGWQENFILLSVRSFEPLYGVDIIINAFIQLAPQIPSLRLLLLGDGSKKKSFMERLQRAGLEDRVKFIGVVKRVELPEYYRAADLYLSASYSDGSSVSLLEAMACGLPSLVSDIPGNQEWITPGVTGWLFESGKVISLIEWIKQVSHSRSESITVCESARVVVQKRADWSKNFPKLLNAYALAREYASVKTG